MKRNIYLLDFIELFISIIGFIVFFVLFIVVNEQQRFLFLIASLYLVYNSYGKVNELKLFNRKTRIVKYSAKKINI